MTAEPTIICPKCKTEIKLTESLAAPLIEATRQTYERRLAQKDEDIASREATLKAREVELAKVEKTIDDQVAEKMKQERAKVAAEEAKKAKLAIGADLEQKTKEVADLQEVLKERNVKLAEAQEAQAEVIRTKRELDDARREMNLTIEKRVQETVDNAREQARKEAEASLKLKVFEKEQTIASMQTEIENLKRKAEQGSQQLQGEVQELEIEALLKAKFPVDSIEPVPKGEYGGDTIQRVVGPMGQVCGTILWESKRTKNWADSWLNKLRNDQRAAQADISILVSQVLPKNVEAFDLVDGVWVTHPNVVIPVAMMLRQSLVEVALARQATEGQQTKMELLYSYLTGPRFRQRIEAIVEAFSSMQEDLDKEKKAITKQWAKREEQIYHVMQATVGMFGDLHGIAGKSLQEIEGLEMKALESCESQEGAQGNG